MELLAEDRTTVLILLPMNPPNVRTRPRRLPPRAGEQARLKLVLLNVPRTLPLPVAWKLFLGLIVMKLIAPPLELESLFVPSELYVVMSISVVVEVMRVTVPP